MYWERIKEIEEEYERIQQRIKEIEEELREMPQGHIEPKKIGNSVYYYLRYWEDGRLKSKYLGKNPGEIQEALRKAEQLRRELSYLKSKALRYSLIMKKIEKILSP